MIILGIDPGTARVGIGVIEKTKSDPKYVHHECIETSKNLELSKVFGEFKRARKKKPSQKIKFELRI